MGVGDEVSDRNLLAAALLIAIRVKDHDLFRQVRQRLADEHGIRFAKGQWIKA